MVPSMARAPSCSSETADCMCAMTVYEGPERPSVVRTDIRPQQSEKDSYLDDIDRTEAAAEHVHEAIGIRDDRGTCFGPGLTLILAVPRASQKMTGERRNG